MRVGIINVGTMMDGKGAELADMMERRMVDKLYVQETRQKGNKARTIGGGFKLFDHGVDRTRNGVRVILKVCEECSGGEVSVRQDHESEAGIRRGDVESCQCVCPTSWMSVSRERGILE